MQIAATKLISESLVKQINAPIRQDIQLTYGVRLQYSFQYYPLFWYLGPVLDLTSTMSVAVTFRSFCTDPIGGLTA